MKHKLVMVMLSVALIVSLALTACVPEVAPEVEEEWPNQPITVVIPSGPGSSMDRLMRGLQQFYSNELGVPVILENKPGGNYIVGMEYMWKQPADGNTIMMFTEPYFEGVLLRAEEVFTNGVEDFAFIGGLNVDPECVLGNPKKRDYQDIYEIIEALQRGEKVTLGISSGMPASMGFYAIAEELNIPRPTYVYYAGGGEKRIDALGGHLDIIGGSHDGHLPLHESGELQFFASFTEERLPNLPDVPTIGEVIEKFGGSRQALPALINCRFLSANSKVKDDYPDRYNKLVSALNRVSQDEGFLKWAKKSGFNIQWVEPETLVEWSHNQFDLVKEYPEAVTGE